MKSVRVSSKGQIVIPKEIRDALDIEEGSELFLELVSNLSPGLGGIAVILPRPRDYARAMRGLGAEIWKDIDTDRYIDEERGSWE